MVDQIVHLEAASSVRSKLNASLAREPTYQAVTAAAAQAGYTITRSSAYVVVRLTQDLSAAASFVPDAGAAWADGDLVKVFRDAGGFFDWTGTGLGVKLGYRGDGLNLLREGGAWLVERLPGRTRGRRESVGRSFDIDDGGAVIEGTEVDTWTLGDSVGTSTGFEITLVQRSTSNPVTLALGGGLTPIIVGGASLTTDGDNVGIRARAIGNSQVRISRVGPATSTQDGSQHRVLRGSFRSYDIESLPTPLILDRAGLDIFGNTTANRTVVVPSPTEPDILDQEAWLRTSGTWAHTVALQDSQGNTISAAIRPNVNYLLRWLGTTSNPRWAIVRVSPRVLGTASQVVLATGEVATVPAPEAVARTFAGTITPDVLHVSFGTFNQSGARSFTKGAGTFDGSEQVLPFNSDGSALTWNAGFRAPSGSLPTSLAAGLWDIVFRYHEARDEFLVAFTQVTAAGVSATAHGGIAATTVQGQLEELETEKAPKASPTFTGLTTVAGVKVASGASVSGALTMAAHGGGIYITGGNCTVPNEGGFSVTLIAGGAHTVGAGGAAHSLATGDVLSVFIPAAGTVRASKVIAANVITLPTS